MYDKQYCIICQSRINSGHPAYRGDRVTICNDCLLDLVEEYTFMRGLGGMQALVLTYLLKCLPKHKRINITKAIRIEVLKKYKMSCINCGSTERLEIDHIKPVIKGGTNDLKNLQVLCKTCNLKKGKKYE